MNLQIVSQRKGLGENKGRGYYNLVNYDRYVHQLAGRGQKVYLDAEGNSFLAQVAQKAKDKVNWAVQWEKEHLPQQTEAVKKAFSYLKNKADSALHRGSPTTAPVVESPVLTNQQPDGFIGPPEPSLMDTMVSAPMPPESGGAVPTNAPLPPPKPIGPTFAERVKGTLEYAGAEAKAYLEKRKEERKLFDDEISKLSDAALRELAIKDPHIGILSGRSKYEQALLDRIKRRAKVDRDIQNVERSVHHDHFVKQKKQGSEVAEFLDNPLGALFKF